MFLLITLLLARSPVAIIAQRDFALHLNSLTANYNEAYAVVNLTHNHSFISFSAHVRQPLKAPLMLRMQINIKTRDTYGQRGDANNPNGYRSFTNKTTNYCDFLRKPTSDPIMNLMHQNAVNNPENRFYTRCPIQIGHYYVVGHTLDFKLLPLMLPSLFFNVHLELFRRETDANGMPREQLIYEVIGMGQVGNRPSRRRNGQ